MSAAIIVLLGLMVAGACLIGARKMGGASPVLRTALYSFAALVVAFLLWLTVMFLFVGSSMKDEMLVEAHAAASA